jgi:hypothetical protein
VFAMVVSDTNDTVWLIVGVLAIIALFLYIVRR